MNVNFTFIFQDPNIAPQIFWTFTILDESKEPCRVTMVNFRDAISYDEKRQKMTEIGQLVAKKMGYHFERIGYSVNSAEGTESYAKKYSGVVFQDFDDFKKNGFESISKTLSEMLPNLNKAPKYKNLNI
jgi:hypothetical protein